MGRTTKEVTIIGKIPAEIENVLDDWFSENGFEVKDWHSDGTPFTIARWGGTEVSISPHAGNIAAIQMNRGVCIAFEISLRKEGNNTILHGEFYAAGREMLIGAYELPLSSKPKVLDVIGILPRRNGYEAMSSLLKKLEEFSGQPLIER